MEETVKEYQRLLAEQIATHQQELDELSRQLQQSASIDDLTGLFTARVFREVLLREVQRARRYRRLLALIVFDVDDYRRLVDDAGAREGQRVLKELAQIVPGRVREVDIMCRLDGAEGPATWMTQGAAYLRSGALGQAEQAFRKAAALAPASARPVLWLGVVAVARGDRGAAVSWFNEALRRHPDLAEQGCAAVWLDMLGIEVNRPQWRLQTPEDYAAFVRQANSGLSSGQARWVGYALVSAAGRSHLDTRILAEIGRAHV